MAARTPEDRILVAQIAAAERWGRTPDRTAATAPARAGLRAKYAREIDPDGTLDPVELERRVDSLMRAHMLRMTLAAKAARRNARLCGHDRPGRALAAPRVRRPHHGQLRHHHPGTGDNPALASQRLWIDAPTLDNPMGSLYVGDSADRADSFSPAQFAMARAPYGHNLAPAGMNVFVVTTNATDAAVSSRHAKRWHTHAAE